MVENPYYNEPGFESQLGTPAGTQASDKYNKTSRHQTLKWAIADPLRQVLDELEGSGGSNDDRGGKKFAYSEFALVIAQHYAQNAEVLEKQLVEWTKRDASIKPQAKVVRDLLTRLSKTQSLGAIDSSAEQALHSKPAARPSGRRVSSRTASSSSNVQRGEVIEIM
jgi:hypothetical protein